MKPYRTYRPIGLRGKLSVWRAWRQPCPAGLRKYPDPCSIGSIHRGQRIQAGIINLAGHSVNLRNRSIWNVVSPDSAFNAERHSFGWLDDLAALASPSARRKALDWLWIWASDFRTESGIVWHPAIAGYRVARLLFHASYLMHGADGRSRERYLKVLSAHLWHLKRSATRSGIADWDRVEALTGLILLAHYLEGRADMATPAIGRLGETLDRILDKDGQLSNRNPEALLTLATQVHWVETALADSGCELPEPLARTSRLMAQNLRNLLHTDNTLPRFHGGGAGNPGFLARVLTTAARTNKSSKWRTMGYVRMTGGRTSVITDVATPPSGPDARTAHASALAFELTFKQFPVVVNCGPGYTFGPEWRRATRMAPAHSTLCLEEQPSTARGRRDTKRGLMPPTEVLCDFHRDGQSTRIHAMHNRYSQSHGLSHIRVLQLSRDGQNLSGEDRLIVDSEKARKKFDRAMGRTQETGLKYFIRLHLHPDISAHLSPDDISAILDLPSGESWQFRQDGTLPLSLDASVYLDPGQPSPRETQQVVLTGYAVNYATSIRWSLARTDE